MMRFPENLRVQVPLRSKAGDNFGCFRLTIGKRVLHIQASSGEPGPEIPKAAWHWDHVSVSVFTRGALHLSRLPTWEEMARIKDLFWEAEDCVMQVHPPKSEYVNMAEVLHLWRWTGGEFPRPPSILVGFK